MEHSTMNAVVARRNTLWSALYNSLIFVAMLGLITAATPVAQANHRSGPEEHNTWIHTNGPGQDELVCFQPKPNEGVVVAEFRDNVRAKLIIDNPNGDWHQLGDNRIFLDTALVNGGVQPCSGFPNRAAIPIENYLGADVSKADPNWVGGAAPCGNISCEDNQTRVFNNAVGHWDHHDSIIWFQRGALYTLVNNVWQRRSNEQRSFIVSHEFGHAFGLADGGQQGDALCLKSVMHAGKGVCGQQPQVFWPTQIDRDSVTNVIFNR